MSRHTYRVWSKSRRKMYNNAQNAYDCMGQSRSDDGDFLYDSSFGDVLANDDYVIMQSVGVIMTENAKELFEHDIVEFVTIPECCQGTRYAEFKMKGVIEYDDEFFEWCVRFGPDTEPLSNVINHIQIVGNVYQNPDLLESYQISRYQN